MSTTSLNAPFGARCFLTSQPCYVDEINMLRLNAPFGARCFLTAPAEASVSGLTMS